MKEKVGNLKKIISFQDKVSICSLNMWHIARNCALSRKSKLYETGEDVKQGYFYKNWVPMADSGLLDSVEPLHFKNRYWNPIWFHKNKFQKSILLSFCCLSLIMVYTYEVKSKYGIRIEFTVIDKKLINLCPLAFVIGISVLNGLHSLICKESDCQANSWIANFAKYASYFTHYLHEI